MRNTFISRLTVSASKNKNIVLIVGDLGYSVVEEFADTFPERFINAGVAEQNMIGLAAGLASEGCHVFCYSIANFPTFRCAEQIRNDVAYHNLPVTIVSVGGGLAYGNLGYSHHAVQDYALMRSMPNMLIGSPADPYEVSSILTYTLNNPSPTYLRLGKTGEPDIHGEVQSVAPGDIIITKKGDPKKLLLCTGFTHHAAIELAAKSTFQNHTIATAPLWSQASKKKFVKNTAQFNEIITLEDHLIDGGFGSWCMEALAQYGSRSCMIYPVALDPVVCGTVGSQRALNTLGGLYGEPLRYNTVE